MNSSINNSNGSNSKGKLSSLIKKNGFNKYILAFSISIAAIIGLNSEKVSANRVSNSGNIDTQINERDIKNEIVDTKELIDLLANFMNESNINLNSEQLNDIYEKYKISNIGPNTRIYIKDTLLKAYIEVLKTGYTIKGYQDLDRLTEIISYLSDKKIDIKSDNSSMPQNSEFRETINISGKLDGERLIIKKKGIRFWLSSNNNKISINIDNEQLLGIFLSDIPNSIKESSAKTAELNRLKSNLEQELRTSITQIGIISFQLEQAKQNNIEIEESYKIAIESAVKEKNDTIKEKTDEFEKAIKSLEESHKKETERLEGIITAKDGEITELRKSFLDERNNLIATHNAEIRRIEDRENNRIVRLQQSFNDDRNKLLLQIKEMEEEQENLRQLHNNQIEILREQITDLRSQLTDFSANNIELNNQITSLNQVIQRLEIEKNSIVNELENKKEELNLLINEKNQLLGQINTVGDAKDLLLAQTQDSLRRNESLNNRLQTRVSQLDSEVTTLRGTINRLETENNRLSELESKGRDLLLATDEIKQLNLRIEQLENLTIELNNRNNRLSSENEQLQNYREIVDKYNALLPELEQANRNIKNLESIIENMKSDIGTLERNNENLGNSLSVQRSNNAVLLSQITELQKSFDDILSGKINISTESLAENLRERNEEIQRLQEENQRLIREKEEAVQNESNAKRELIRVQAEFAEKEDEMRREHYKNIAKLMREFHSNR